MYREPGMKSVCVRVCEGARRGVCRLRKGAKERCALAGGAEGRVCIERKGRGSRVCVGMGEVGRSEKGEEGN